MKECCPEGSKPQQQPQHVLHMENISCEKVKRGPEWIVKCCYARMCKFVIYLLMLMLLG